MNYETKKETLEKMTDSERQVAMVLYLTDIKDLLLSICEHNKVPLKHY